MRGVFVRWSPEVDESDSELNKKITGFAHRADTIQVIYDNNQITCDGSVDLTNTEDVNKKMEACGWEIIDVEDGVNDVDAIVAAMEKGRDPNRSKPLLSMYAALSVWAVPKPAKQAHTVHRSEPTTWSR